MSARMDSTVRDRSLETRIERALRGLNRRPSRIRWYVLRNLIRQRSPEQVAKMEIAKGLR